jgi:hypothetical protein
MVRNASPLSLDRTPGTFSQRTQVGRTRPTSPRNASARLPRGSAIPCRSPAMENAWQGVPAARTSIRPAGMGVSPRDSASRSPRLTLDGCRSASTIEGNAAVSAHHAVAHPSCWAATSGAPMPEHAVARVSFRVSAPCPRPAPILAPSPCAGPPRTTGRGARRRSAPSSPAGRTRGARTGTPRWVAP